MKKQSLYYTVLTIFIYILQLQVFIQVEEVFSYFGFVYAPDFKTIAQSIFFLFLSIPLIIYKDKDDLKSVFLKYWHFFVYIPNSILLYAASTSTTLIVLHFIFLTTIKLVFIGYNKIYVKAFFFKTSRTLHKKTRITLFILSTLLFVPFIQFLPNFDFRAFSLGEIYTVRAEARETSNILSGYIRAPLVRVILPALIIIGVLAKRRMYTLMASLLIILIYASTGALKSIIAVIPLVLLFIGCKTFLGTVKRLQFLLIFILLLAIIENYFLNTYFISNMPNRRLLFFPGLIEQAYINEFQNNSQFYQHSIFSFFNSNPISITKLIGGEYFGRPEMNANVGVVLDGFVNLGIFGVVLHAIIIGFSIVFLNTLNIKPAFIGLILAYFYYINTSFIGTLFITHGFLFLLLFGRLFLNNYAYERITHLPKL